MHAAFFTAERVLEREDQLELAVAVEVGDRGRGHRAAKGQLDRMQQVAARVEHDQVGGRLGHAWLAADVGRKHDLGRAVAVEVGDQSLARANEGIGLAIAVGPHHLAIRAIGVHSPVVGRQHDLEPGRAVEVADGGRGVIGHDIRTEVAALVDERRLAVLGPEPALGAGHVGVEHPEADALVGGRLAVLVVATEHDLVVAVGVDVGDDGRRIGEFRAIAGAPTLLGEREIVVGLDAGHPGVGEAGRGREIDPEPGPHAEADRVVGRDHVHDPVAVEVARADVLVEAAVVDAVARGGRALADLRPAARGAAVEFEYVGRWAIGLLGDQDLVLTVAVDVGGRDAADLGVAERDRPAGHELAGVIIDRDVEATVVGAGRDRDLDVAVGVEVPDHRRRPHSHAAVLGRGRGRVGPGRLPQRRAAVIVDVEDRVASGDDVELAVAVDVDQRGRGQPILVPAAGQGRAQDRGLDWPRAAGGRGGARGRRRLDRIAGVGGLVLSGFVGVAGLAGGEGDERERAPAGRRGHANRIAGGSRGHKRRCRPRGRHRSGDDEPWRLL